MILFQIIIVTCRDFQRNYLVRDGQKEPSKNGSQIKYNNFTKRLLDKVLAKLFDYIIAQKEDKRTMDFIQNVLACFSRKMEEINIDWKVVAVDLNRDLIAAQEENKVLRQRNADLEKIVEIYKEKEKIK
jgi:hypothetical protein|nr:MAG TPA: hypothetical protein [Caudoviricetes sp.]